MSAFKSGNVRRRGPWDMSLLVLLLVLLSSLTGTVVSQDEDLDGDAEVTTEEAPADVDVTDDVTEDVAEDVVEDVAEDVDLAAEAPPDEGTEEVAEGADPPAEEDNGDNQDPDAISELPSTDATAAPDELAEGDVLTDDSSGSGMEGDPTEAPPDTSPVIILIPVVLVVVIIGMVVAGIVINRRWNRNKSYKTDIEKEDPYLDDNNTEKVPMPMFEEDVPSVLELEMEELDQWMNKDGGTTVDSKQIEL